MNEIEGFSAENMTESDIEAFLQKGDTPPLSLQSSFIILPSSSSIASSIYY